MANRDGGRYPCQLVVMVTRETREAVDLLVDLSGRSISEVLRETVAAGLPIAAGRARRGRAVLAEALREADASQDVA